MGDRAQQREGLSPGGGPGSATMRCRAEKQVPRCFRDVECPYPREQTAAGAFGAINYALVGPSDGELVVCLHGLNGSRVLFNDTAAVLSRHGGFQVLSFDLYGHGLSNAPYVDLCPCSGCGRCGERLCCGAPRGRYDMDFFVEQINDLLSILGFEDTPVNLVGFSLGGAICVAFAQKYPSRVLRLVPMSPAGFLPKVPVSYYLLKAVWCCLIPMAPHLLCTYWYKRERFARSLRGEGHVDNEVIESLWSRFVWQLYVKRGVASATLATCHRIPWFNLKPVFKAAGKHPRPVLLIWGEKDSLNPQATVAKEVESCFSNKQLLVVPGAGHIAICDRPRQVVFSILSFLQMPTTTQMGQQQFAIPTSVLPAPPRPLATGGPRPQPTSPPAVAAAAGAVAEPEPELPGISAAKRKAASAAQMPVPMVLGHAEDVTPNDDFIDESPGPDCSPGSASPGQPLCSVAGCRGDHRQSL